MTFISYILFDEIYKGHKLYSRGFKTYIGKPPSQSSPSPQS